MYSYKCKKCGSEIGVDNQGHLQCSSCGRKIIETSLVDIEKHERSADCPRCNGELRKHSFGEIMVCDYCDSTFVLESYFKKTDNQYDTVLLFQNDSREDILEKFYIACTKEFAPHDFRAKAKINEVNNVYIPFYRFEVKCNVHYSVEVAQRKTRKVYNATSQKYETKQYTDWVEQTGNFTEIYRITTNGFSSSIESIGKFNLLTEEENKKEFSKMCDLITDTGASFANSKTYSPLLLENHEVVKPTSAAKAWSSQGNQKLENAIKHSVRKLFSENTRNVNFKKDIVSQTSKCKLYPMSFVSYDYDEKSKNRMIVLDGIDGNLYRGTVPLSTNRIIKTVSRWLIPVVTAVLGVLLYNIESLNSTTGGTLLMLLCFVLAVVLWLWFGKIQGTAGDKSSKQHENNVSVNKKFGIIAGFVILAIIASGIYGNYETEEYNARKQNSTTKPYTTNYKHTTEPTTKPTEPITFTVVEEPTKALSVLDELEITIMTYTPEQYNIANQIITDFCVYYNLNINDFKMVCYGYQTERENATPGFVFIDDKYNQQADSAPYYYFVDITANNIHYCVVDSFMENLWQDGQPYEQEWY